MAHSTQPDAAVVSVPITTALELLQLAETDSRSFSGQSTSHLMQAEGDEILRRPLERPLPNVWFWQDVLSAFAACHTTLTISIESEKSGGAKEWTGIIERRMLWMEEDAEKLQSSIDLNQHPVGAYRTVEIKTSRRIPRQTIGYAVALVDDAELKRICRKQEDRLRRLRSGAITDVAKRPSMAEQGYAAGLTYDEKIKSTLRDVFEQCARARKAFAREVDKAVEKERKR